jgi:hypothetical protein
MRGLRSWLGAGLTRAGRYRLPALAGLLTLLHAGAVEAQDVPAPAFHARAHGDSLLLTVGVPEGWSLYAPAGNRAGAPPAGRPLRILSGGEAVTFSAWPEPVLRSTVLGTARVHEAGSHTGTLRLGPGAPGELEIEWALCSDTLCVPGRSRVRY